MSTADAATKIVGFFAATGKRIRSIPPKEPQHLVRVTKRSGGQRGRRSLDRKYEDELNATGWARLEPDLDTVGPITVLACSRPESRGLPEMGYDNVRFRALVHPSRSSKATEVLSGRGEVKETARPTASPSRDYRHSGS